jgi:carboxypeptidase Taq
MAQIAKLSHEMGTSARIGELLEACESDSKLMKDPVSVASVNVREIRHEYDRKPSCPRSWSRRKPGSQACANGLARSTQGIRFQEFQPYLERIVDLLRRKAQAYGLGPRAANRGMHWPRTTNRLHRQAGAGCLYAAAAAAASIAQRFDGQQEAAVERLQRVEAAIEQQEKFVRFVAEQIGFDFKRGRLDVSTHPFCGGTHCNDVRITTRAFERTM